MPESRSAQDDFRLVRQEMWPLDHEPKSQDTREALAALDRIEEQLEALRQALRETWDDYAIAIDDHASEEVRKEARHSMLRRFSEFQDEGWLASSPASRSNDG